MTKKPVTSRSSIEKDSFDLLRDMQRHLADVLNSLGGKSGDGLFEHYLFYSSVQINHAAEAFIALRETGRVDASKLLVRPAMELLFRQQAVGKKPELLYRMAYSERLEDRKWLTPVWKRKGKDYDLEDKRQWQEFTRKYAKQYPKHPRSETKLTLFDVAKAANLDGYYDSYYRLYCQFTHGAFRAMVGSMKFSDFEDNRTVAACVFSALESLHQGVKANVPKIVELRQRFCALP
jgi:hypothetical protein